MSTESIQHLPYFIAKQHFKKIRHNEFHHKSKISEVSVKKQGLGGLKIGQKLTTYLKIIPPIWSNFSLSTNVPNI